MGVCECFSRVDTHECLSSANLSSKSQGPKIWAFIIQINITNCLPKQLYPFTLTSHVQKCLFFTASPTQYITKVLIFFNLIGYKCRFTVLLICMFYFKREFMHLFLCRVIYPSLPVNFCSCLLPNNVNYPLFLRRISVYFKKLVTFIICIANVFFSDYHLPFHFV